jgi:hypothetical protein
MVAKKELTFKLRNSSLLIYLKEKMGTRIQITSKTLPHYMCITLTAMVVSILTRV